MTAIVGLVHKGKVYIGGDSAGSTPYTVTDRLDEKVFINGPFVIGFTTSYRMGQLLRYSLSVTPPAGDPFKYMVTTFVDAVRDCLKAGGYAKKESDTETGGSFLVGHKGRLFYIDADYQVGEHRDGYCACGSGAEAALGSLYSTPTLKPVARLTRALEAAEHFYPGVRGPFLVVREP